MQNFFQDLRFGFRMLRRSPGFSILAILCLTLGIGTNAAVLSWFEGILIRPYPLVAHQDRMFALNATTRGESGYTGLSYPEFLDYEKNFTLFESFVVDKITATTLSVGDRAERASGAIVSAATSSAASNLQTFTVAFDDASSEGGRARAMAEQFGTTHHELRVDATHIVSDLETVLAHLEDCARCRDAWQLAPPSGK